MVLGTILFFFFYSYFNFSTGGKIDFEDLISLSKLVFTVAIIPSALYFGLYFISGKKLATQIGGGLALLMFVAFLIGYIRFGM